jgi:uncharacterized membrane protein SirB2
MEYQALHFLHILGGLLLVAYTFYAFAGPAAETKKRVMIITGVANLLILLTGVRMWQSLHGFAPLTWVIVKIVCWLGLAAFAGLAYRRREKAGVFATVSVLLLTVIVAMAYFQPGK